MRESVCITNVRFKSILKPYKCQIANFFPEPHWGPSEQAPKPPCFKAEKFPFEPNNPNWKFVAHTLKT